MGFYGNITSTSKTSFQFDRVYTNRVEMDKSSNSDGVYVGRYVLVEYDKNINPVSYTTVYKRSAPEPNNKNAVIFGLSVNAAGELNSRVIIGDGENGLPNNSVVRVPGATKDGNKNYFNQTYRETTVISSKYEKNTYYTYDKQQNRFILSNKDFDPLATYYVLYYGSTDEYYKVYGSEGDIANFSRILGDEDGKDATNYVWNYNIDISVYGPSRGYDSTVWQKTVENGHDKYVMIAELNSVVPTFDISADAPTIVPQTPHFDTASTNVYYKLHWQPSWGFRIKPADTAIRGPVLTDRGNSEGSYTILTEESKEYPSDVNTAWIKNEYDSSTNKMSQYYLSYNEETHEGQWNDILTSDDINTVPAAIYFNKAGFDPEVVAYSDDKDYEGWKDKKVTDIVRVSPTGKSGHKYNLHNGTTEMGPKTDTQELEMMLPSLGDSMAHIWDLVYGGRDTTQTIKETNRRNLDVKWEDASSVLYRHGLRMVNEQPEKFKYNNDSGDNKYNKASVNTLAGCINSVHDLMGMIISPRQGLANFGDPEGLDDSLIYYDTLGGKYYRKHLTYDYEEIPFTADNYTMVAVDVDAANYAPGLYYISSASGSNIKPENCEISNSAYDSTKVYYKKQLKAQESMTPVDITGLLDFSSGDYWYSDTNGDSVVGNDLNKMNFIKDSIYHKGKDYYQVTSGPRVSLITDYKPNTLFYYTDTDLDENESGYKLDTKQEFTPDRKYVKLSNITKIKDLPRKYDGVYLPNTFYYKAVENEERTPWELLPDSERENTDFVYILDTTETGKGIVSNALEINHYAITPTKVEGGQIYRLVEEYKLVKNVTKEMYDNNEYYFVDNYGRYIAARSKFTYESLPAQTVLFELLKVWKKTDTAYSISDKALFLMTFDSKNPVYVREPLDPDDPECTLYNYVYLTQANIDPTCKTDYYQFSVEELDTFYEPYRYHYQIKDETNPNYKSFLLDKQKHIERDDEKEDYYYELGKTGKIVKVTKDFFEPNKYYDINGNLVEKKPTNTNTVYKKRDLFIVEDTQGIYSKGAKWNRDVKSVPASVKIGTREERYEVIPIEELAESLNTIHGLILQINKILERDDTLTRDNSTIQGTLNELHDIIDKFDKLQQNQFVIVDDYGRIHSAPLALDQKTTATAIKDKDNGIKGDSFPQVNSLSDMKDQWLTVYINDNPNDPKITFRHNFQSVKDTTSTTDKNGNVNPDTVQLYMPIVDKMGHVVGKNTETVTLPYGFKTITTNGQSSSVTINTSNPTVSNVVADNTQDILGINSGNKWVKIDTDANADTLTFSHLVKGFTSGAANTKYGLTATKSIQDLDKDNTFIVPYFEFDEAGHILSAGDNTITIPEVFTDITVSTSNTTNTDSLVGKAGTAQADTLQDVLSIKEGNRWINISVDPDNDSLTFSHYVKGFAETSDSLDFNNTTAKTFAVQDISWDRAGHITGSVKNTFTLPDGFSSVKIVNDNLNQVTDTTAANGTINAGALKDSFTIGNGNRWIKLVAGEKQFNIVHAAPDTVAENLTSTLSDEQTPKFNEKFNIPVIKYDKAGHISSITTTAVTIPNITLSSGTGNVVTGITYSNGAFTAAKSNIGALVLTGYNAFQGGAIAAANTLNEGLYNLDSALSTEIINRKNAIESLDYSAVTVGQGEIISSISETNGIVDVSTRKLEQKDISGLLGNMALEDKTNYATSQNFNSLKDKVNGLTSSSEVPTKNIIGSITQTEGKVAITVRELTHADMPKDYVTLEEVKDDIDYISKATIEETYLSKSETYAYDGKQITIEDLLNEIDLLRQRIEELETK